MPEMIENRMVVNWQWPEASQENEENSNSPGYKEMGTGIFVPKEDAFEYAMERISRDENEKREFLEWFYSGNWVKEE